MKSKQVHVAVGVIVREQHVFITLRGAHQHQGGLWEFPGGKVEPDEPFSEALHRELKEELGIDVLAARPLIDLTHDYGDKHVRLETWVVEQFTGEPKGMEGQQGRWVAKHELANYAFPEANIAILHALLAENGSSV